MKTTAPRAVLALLALATALSAALPAQAAGDVEKGRVKANTCMGCHGIPNYNNAYPTYRVPRLGGQHPEYIIAALKEYRAGARPHPTMRAQATSMTDQDMEDIAAWLAVSPEHK
jgi:cytochrome c553